MRKLLHLISFTFLLFSCSEDNHIGSTDGMDNGGGSELPEKIIELKLKAKNETVNIFELMQFNLFSNENFTGLDLMNSYDSVIWKVADLPGGYKIFSYSNNSFEFSYQWSHNFYIPGKHNCYLLGYKNNEVIHSDTIEINIHNNKDFLEYYWKDIKGSIGHSTGYHDSLQKGYSFSTYQDIHDGIPCISFFVRCSNPKDENNFILISKQILYDHINSLYSFPSYDMNEPDILLEKYNLFNYKYSNAHPHCIWITPESRIVLIERYDGIYNNFEIYAEPNL